MAKGNSGRLVIEIDPSIKKELYDTLSQKGLNIKRVVFNECKSIFTKKKFKIRPTLKS